MNEDHSKSNHAHKGCHCEFCETKRAAAKERSAKFRERQRLTAPERILAREEEERRAQENIIRKRNTLVFYGEESTGVNARDHDTEVQIHREFLRALDQPDVQVETLRELARRTWQAYLTKAPGASFDDGLGYAGSGVQPRYAEPSFYVPSFNRFLQTWDHDLGHRVGDEPFEEIWTPPAGCSGDEPIDIDSLPKLPYRAVQKKKAEPAPITAVTPVETFDVPTTLSTQEKNAIMRRRMLDAGIHPDAIRFLEG